VNDTAIIVVAAGPAQNTCFWPSYIRAEAGMDHDLIVVHMNEAHLRKEWIPPTAITENKGNLPNRAFGAYRHYGQKYMGDYKYLAFVSDDVIFKRNSWLRQARAMLRQHELLGFVGTQIFNGGAKYPHPSHMRAPIWFTKTEALAKISWQFSSDHDGEMRIADQFVAAGYFGCQIGNKFNFAYDALQSNHISQLAERMHLFYVDEHYVYTNDEIECYNETRQDDLDQGIEGPIIESPFDHIGKRFFNSHFEPFDGLIYDRSSHIANEAGVVTQYPFGVEVLSGWNSLKY
jgi:hypothetical protein